MYRFLYAEYVQLRRTNKIFLQNSCARVRKTEKDWYSYAAEK